MSPAVFGHGRLRLYLLKLLAESPRHGYDVIRELEDRFLGRYSPSAGTVYPRLARLEAEGLVTQQVAQGRKIYSITDAGRAELAARQDELDDLEADIAGSVRDLADEIRSEVRGSVRDLRAELKAAAREIRVEARSRARSSSSSADVQRPPRTGDELGEWITGMLTEVTAGVARWAPSASQREELAEVLARAVEDVRRILAAPRRDP